MKEKPFCYVRETDKVPTEGYENVIYYKVFCDDTYIQLNGWGADGTVSSGFCWESDATYMERVKVSKEELFLGMI